ncbi:MAG: DUF2922 domain-containing protein [Synergistes sp.]|nr:DUF2922 domain-containing protein [Synergistes sp.]
MSTTENTIKMTFGTQSGKEYNVSLKYADPALLDEGGAAKVAAAMDSMITDQPFETALVSKKAAKFIKKTETDIPLA